MNWNEIKTKAKQLSKEHIWDIWKPILVVGLISMVVGFLSGMGEDNTVISIVAAIAEIFLIPAEIGLMSYFLDIVRGKEADLKTLTKYYNNKFTVLILIAVFVFLYTLLWSLLLIIPGIICALSYSMSYYVFVDNDNLTHKECMAKSKEMLNGYKMDYFLFTLSFIGWAFLCVFIIPAIWVIPYITCAETIYYDELQKKLNS